MRMTAICDVSKSSKIVPVAMIKRYPYLERQIIRFRELMAKLKYRAPALELDYQTAIYQPLPQTFNGRLRAYLFLVSMGLLCLAVGGGIAWSGLNEAGLRLVSTLFFGLWSFGIGGLLLYLSFYFTWRLTLLPDKIVVQFPFHKRQFTLSDLQFVRLVTTTSSRSPKPNLTLALTLANGRSLRITQQEMPVPLMHLMEMLVHHYRLSLTYEKEPISVHHTQFGAGSRRPFTDYLNGQSQIEVQSIEDVCRWLQECEYVRDSVLFNQRDVWQHPGDFETLKKGDCEDHALWAWRKLTELNIPAEFVVGRAQWNNGSIDAQQSAHAWVAYEENGRIYILETTHKKRLIYPLAEIATRYHPWYSVDEQNRTYRFVPVAGQVEKRET